MSTKASRRLLRFMTVICGAVGAFSLTWGSNTVIWSGPEAIVMGVALLAYTAVLWSEQRKLTR